MVWILVRSITEVWELQVHNTYMQLSLSKGGSHVESRRNSLVVMSAGLAIFNVSFRNASILEATMQTEIEILETRETPEILWY